MRNPWSALNTLGPTRVAAIHLRAVPPGHEPCDIRCTYCARFVYPVERQVDHVVPRARGGGDDASNLVLACADCNAKRRPGEVPPRVRRAGRTLADIRAEVRRQTRIDIGPGSAIYERALEYAREVWPEQFERRARARDAYLEREALRFFEEVAA